MSIFSLLSLRQHKKKCSNDQPGKKLTRTVSYMYNFFNIYMYICIWKIKNNSVIFYISVEKGEGFNPYNPPLDLPLVLHVSKLYFVDLPDTVEI